MPGKGSLAALSFLVLALLPIAPAQAGIPIPCTGEALVKVLDVPALEGTVLPANQDMPEKRLDLGYLFRGCLSGEWVGHIGHDTRYVHLTEAQLDLMLTSLGRDRPPPAPSIWTVRKNAEAAVIWGLMVGVVLLFGFVQWQRRAGSGASPDRDWGASIEQAAMAYNAPKMPTGYRRPAAVEEPTSSASASPARSRSGSSAFGRRPMGR